MVTIIDYKTHVKEDGDTYCSLVLQGSMEIITSKESGRKYASARKAAMLCTFNESTCESLIGTTLPGSIQKVKCEPYEYQVPNSDEIKVLDYRYEYQEAEEKEVSSHSSNGLAMTQ